MIRRLLHFLGFWCRHPHTFRERRKLHGLLVTHLVCADCGYAVPAITRTPKEHRAALRQGAVTPLQAHQASKARTSVIVLPRKAAR